MAVQLLFFVFFNSLYGTKAEALPPPNLTVDRLVMTETDSVTLNCSAPPHVSVARCDFYIQNKEMSSNSSCVETLTGSEMLRMLSRRSPADVKVKCLYTVKDGALQSPDSESTLITINNLLPAILTVNPLVITESDSVTLNCQPPSSVPVSDCYFYIGREKIPQRFSCLKTMTAADLLSLTKQSSPANIDVTCFYLKSHPSPKSNLLSIIIQRQTFRTTIETESPFSSPPSSVNPTLFATTDPSGRTTVNTVSTLSTSPSEAADRTDVSESDLLTRPLTPTKKDLTTSQTIVPAFPVSTVMMIWRFIAVGITSLILFGLTLKCCISRMEKCFSKRSKAEVSVEQIQMSSLNNRDE
ncbi:uncharacterized protein LOC111605798 isoform X2 [Xiphophorus maculatus]|uniref:uncharacterized protein LOC111605798 isoform X2 n=1 Tax=Xiphophorus maculatus TaxID=8083 RepID=UPI000C6ED0F4|nr:uncharacterized protein LOC111605798 isoform X2 [Xiphophorus maculatus]